MNRRNFFKGVLGTLAGCVVGKVIPKPARGVPELRNLNLPNVDNLLETGIKGVCHNAGVPYRLFVCKHFDEQVAKCD